MNHTGPFSATKIEYEYSESEALGLRVKLLALRKKYMQCLQSASMHEVKDIEAEIADVEYKLAHASIVPDLEPQDSPHVLGAISDEVKGMVAWLRKKARENWHTHHPVKPR